MELLNDIRSVLTVIAFTTFLGIVFWAWSARRKRDFDEAAQLPFHEDDDLPRAADSERGGQ